MTENRTLRWCVVIVLLLCFVPLALLHEHIAKRRGDLRVAQPWEPYAAGDRPIMYNATDVPVEELTGIVFGGLIAGFRHQAANITYWRMQRYWEDGHWHRVLGMLKLTCFLDPHFVQAWQMLGWHQAYNMAAEMDRDDAAIPPERYVEDGLTSFQRGLEFNPGEFVLYEEAAWTAFDKGGRMDEAAELAEKATLTWDPTPDITKDGPLIQGRARAHTPEEVGEVERALEYHHDLMRYMPYDSVGVGATVSMRERYLPAVRAFQRGDEDTAFELIGKIVKDRGRDVIALSLLSQMYLQSRHPDPYGALAAIECAAFDWRNKAARVECARLINEDHLIPGRKRDLAGVNYAWQLDVRRLYGNYVKQRPGMGVALSVRQDDAGQPVAAPVVSDGEIVRIDASPGAEPLAAGEARFYLDGCRIGTDSEAPYTVRLDLSDYDHQAVQELSLKCEFIPADGSRVRWDVVTVKLPWSVTPGPAAQPPMDMQKMMKGKMSPGSTGATPGAAAGPPAGPEGQADAH